MHLITFVYAACLSLAASFVTFAQAQDAWPSKTVRVIVPSGPGAGLDLATRLLAEVWTKEFGRPFVVENMPGAANTVGTAAAARATPDGHTILHTSQSAIVQVPYIRKNLTYKPAELVPVAQTMLTTNTLVVSPSRIDAKTLPDLIKQLRATPDKFNYGSSGVGGFSHLIHELFMLSTNTRITHVPHKSPPEVTTALLGGHLDLAFVSTTPALPHIRKGTLRAIAVAPAQRVPELPDVPAIREIIPEFGGANTWNGLFVPVGTPRAVIERLNKSTNAYLKTPQAVEAMSKMGASAVTGSPNDFSGFIKQEAELWSRVIKTAGVTE